MAFIVASCTVPLTALKKESTTTRKQTFLLPRKSWKTVALSFFALTALRGKLSTTKVRSNDHAYWAPFVLERCTFQQRSLICRPCDHVTIAFHCLRRKTLWWRGQWGWNWVSQKNEFCRNDQKTINRDRLSIAGGKSNLQMLNSVKLTFFETPCRFFSLVSCQSLRKT